MHKKFLLALILFISSSLAHAQVKYEWKQANSGAYQYRYVENDPMQARYYTLANGLTVILSVNKNEPRLQTLIATKAGSKHDRHYFVGKRKTHRGHVRVWASECPGI